MPAEYFVSVPDSVVEDAATIFGVSPVDIAEKIYPVPSEYINGGDQPPKSTSGGFVSTVEDVDVFGTDYGEDFHTGRLDDGDVYYMDGPGDGGVVVLLGSDGSYLVGSVHVGFYDMVAVFNMGARTAVLSTKASFVK